MNKLIYILKVHEAGAQHCANVFGEEPRFQGPLTLKFHRRRFLKPKYRQNIKEKITKQNVSKWLTWLASGCVKDSCFLIYIHLHFLNFLLEALQTPFFVIRKKKKTRKRNASHISSYYFCCYVSSANGRHIFYPFLLSPGAEALKEVFDTKIKMRISLEQMISSWTLLQY